MKYLWLASGGAAGTILRYLLVSLTDSKHQTAFPWGTFSVNLSGSLVIGLLAGAFLKNNLTDEWKLFLCVGLLGGFTTFSSLAIEAVQLFRAGNIFTGLIYVVLTNVTGILLAWLGFEISKKLFPG